MSAPSRGAGVSRPRSTTPPATRGRGAKGASRVSQTRGRGRGAAAATTNLRAEGLVQGLQAGTIARRGSDNGTIRGARGRGTAIRGTTTRGQFTNSSKIFNGPRPVSTAPKTPAVQASSVDFVAQAATKFESLKRNREAERAKAIRDGFLADPDKKTTLDNAITPVGTCTEMCPAFERVERIVQRMVDKSEKARDDSNRPDEERMVKRFRRSAAGYDEQLPSDIRTPATLKMTLDYLLDNIIGGGERLASVHKFVWDRTRGIRNDFSIQQVTKKEDVRIAVECLERIARFHILSLHQLSNPENLVGEQFDAHQDREQLNNTLLSLMYYYDDNRHVLNFPNEAEFRAYCIIFELQSQHPDLEDRMQSWPKAILEDGRVKTAFKLYAAAGNNLFDQGPLRPMTAFSLAQGNTGSFWSILSSKQVSYLMACVAEIYFGQVRYIALQALWAAATSAPVGTRAKNQDWTLEELANVLGFDTEEQAAEFCEVFELKISTRDDGAQFLDVSLNKVLEKSSIPTKQVFSFEIVEAKRFRRTLTAVINGKTVPQAVREGLVESDDSLREGTEEEESADDGESLFLPEKKAFSANPFAKPIQQAAANPFTKPVEQTNANPFAKAAGHSFNPQALAFTPGIFQQPVTKAEPSANPFAEFGPAKPFATEAAQVSANPFLKATNSLPTTSQPKVDSPTTAAKSANPFSNSNGNVFSFVPQSTPPKPVSQAFVFSSGGFTATSTAAPVSTAAPATSTSLSPSDFTSPPTSISTIPSQPPAFSWANARETTESTVTSPVSWPEFYAANKNVDSGPSISPTFTPPGTVVNQQTAQPKPTATKPPQIQQHSDHTPNPLQPNHSGTQLTFSVEANGPPASTIKPSTTLPHPFPQNPSSLVDRSPQDILTQHHKNIVLPSVEVDTANAPTTSATRNTPSTQYQSSHAINPPGGHANNPVQLDADESRPRSSPPGPGYQWSDPTVPGYRNLTSRAAQPSKPQKPPLTAADKQRIVDALAHVAMTQERCNLMDEFVKFVVPEIINSVIDQHNKEIHRANSKIIREEYLLRKYVKRMGDAYWSRKLSGWSERRREGFVEIEQQEKRQSQSGADIEQIVAEMQESARIRAEVAANLEREQRERVGRTRQKEDSEAQALKATKPAKANQIAGRKRKSEASEDTDTEIQTRLDLAGRPYTPRHKRSRTETHIDADQESDDVHERHQVRYTRIPHTAGRSLFSRHLSAYGTRLASEPSLRRSVDNTHTDYFKLRARGIDPETPFVPLTARQVEQRRHQAEAEKARLAADSKPWQGTSTLMRLSNGLPAWGQPKLTAFEMPPPAKPPPRPLHAPEKPKTVSDSVNDLLAKLKEVRQEQESDASWFKAQLKELEEEEEVMKQGEQTIQVHQTIERHNGSQTDSSGLARSQLGYGYVPAESKPGHTLSRTEQRIRRTGARGLATAPLGGTPGYVKPEVGSLERSLRASLEGTGNREQDTAGTNGTRNGAGIIDPKLQSDDPLYVVPHAAKYIPNGKGKERAVDDESTTADSTAKGRGYSQLSGPTANDFSTTNTYNGLNLDEDEESHQQGFASEDVLQEDEEYSEEDEDAEVYEEEDLLDEEDDYDDEDEYEDEEQARPSHRGQHLSATPDVGEQASRAASSGAYSGIGASADDAIDLDSE